MIIDKKHLIDCYRKFKSYVFYSKNHSFIYKDIADYESNIEVFETNIESLTNALVNEDYSFFENLFSKIEVVPVIKSIEIDKSKQTNIYSNELPKSEKTILTGINYFVKCPIELYLVDVFWTLIALSASSNNGERFCFCYANYPSQDLINKNGVGLLGKINFNTLSIYEPYFEKYKDWQNTIINEALKLKHKKTDLKLVSLDITSFFYNANVDFAALFRYLQVCDSSVNNYVFLHTMMNRMYSSYKKVLSRYCVEKSLSDMPIPIGLISSGFISNFILSDFDNKLNSLEHVVLANRYVDDILVLLEDNTNNNFDQLIDSSLGGLFCKTPSGEYSMNIEGMKLLIKNDKLRLFDIKHNRSDHTLQKLQKDIFLPSGVKLFPKYVSNFEQLYDRSVKDDKTLKIRDNIQKPNINATKLAGSLSGFLLMQNNVNDDKYSQSKTAESILGLFDSSIVLSIFQRWDKLLSFFISLRSKNKFKQLYAFIKGSIKKISKTADLDVLPETMKLMKHYLYVMCDVAVSQSLAPYGSKKWKENEYIGFGDLSRKVRKANLFDHSLVDYPLSNYFQDDEEDNLLEFRGEKQVEKSIDVKTKILLSPRFIHLDEFLYFKQCQSVFGNNLFAIDYESIIEEYNKKILPCFSTKKEELVVSPTCIEGYNLINVRYKGINNDTDKVPVALANIDLSKHELTKGDDGYSSKLNRCKGTVREKSILIDLLNSCYFNKVKISNKEDKEELIHAQHLVFPEFYLPIEWLGIIIKFSRKVGTTVVTGLKPIKIGGQVLNLQAVVVPFTDAYHHSESMVFIRQKNNYPPLERQIYKNSKLFANDTKPPVYFLFNDGNLTFSTFVCYELTDVKARSLFKNKVDFIVSSEYNEDISYFSNIVQSSARDLNCFVIQVNSSNYGDSRIVAPYRDKYREILSITGGVKDSVHIGIMNLKSFKNYMVEFRKCDRKSDYKDINPNTITKKKKYGKFKKPSAGVE